MPTAPAAAPAARSVRRPDQVPTSPDALQEDQQDGQQGDPLPDHRCAHPSENVPMTPAAVPVAQSERRPGQAPTSPDAHQGDQQDGPQGDPLPDRRGAHPSGSVPMTPAAVPVARSVRRPDQVPTSPDALQEDQQDGQQGDPLPDRRGAHPSENVPMTPIAAPAGQSDQPANNHFRAGEN